jgi:S1-C subfamily serine protease
VTIFLGFSGGPLLDAQGRVVGINTTGLWRNMALAVPAGTVDRVSKELLEKGRIARAYLGLGMQPVALPDALTRKLKLSHKAGLIVFTVEPGSPAERAGALIGDILIALDEKPVTDMGDVQAFLESGGIGKSVRASFVRGGAPVELAIVLGERPRREE